MCDRVRIEIRNPASAAGLIDLADRRGVAAVAADTQEPRLLIAGRIEREPIGEQLIAAEHLENQSMTALIGVKPRTGETRADRCRAVLNFKCADVRARAAHACVGGTALIAGKPGGIVAGVDRRDS